MHDVWYFHSLTNSQGNIGHSFAPELYHRPILDAAGMLVRLGALVCLALLTHYKYRFFFTYEAIIRFA